jgi:hypothetical protein
MIQAYCVKKEIPRHFIKLLPKQCPPIQAREICRYFEHTDVYLFDTRMGFVPWIERKYVELWNELFEPVTRNV